MSQHHIHYDETSDTLYISFEPGVTATGIELNDHILLRLDLPQEKAVGLTFLDYSFLAQATELGPRSFPLTGLAQLTGALYELVVKLLLQPPVSEFLSFSTYTSSAVDTMPITVVQPIPAVIA